MSSRQCAVCSEETGNLRICKGCSAFFRRHKDRTDLFCNNGTLDCELNPRNRAVCRGCRMKKCRAVGMGENKENASSLKRITETKREDEDVKRSRVLQLQRLPDNPGTNPDNNVARIEEELIVSRNDTSAPSTSSAPQPAAPQPAAPTARSQALIELAKILPPKGYFAQILLTTNPRPDLLTFGLLAAEKFKAQWTQNVFTFNDSIKNLDAYTKSAVTQKAFFLVYVLDAAWAVFDRQTEVVYSLDNKRKVTALEVVFFGNRVGLKVFSQVVDVMRAVGFNKCDYCLFRQLAFYDESVMKNNETFRNNHLATLNAWKQARQLKRKKIDELMQLFQSFVIIASKTRDYLISKYEANKITHKATLMIYVIAHAKGEKEIKKQQKLSRTTFVYVNV